MFETSSPSSSSTVKVISRCEAIIDRLNVDKESIESFIFKCLTGYV